MSCYITNTIYTHPSKNMSAYDGAQYENRLPEIQFYAVKSCVGHYNIIGKAEWDKGEQENTCKQLQKGNSLLGNYS